MKYKIICIIIFTSLIVGLIAPETEVKAVSPIKTNLISPDKILNSDGTLNLDKDFTGVLDLSGWNVQLDEHRGPVFSFSAKSGANWSALGNNGSGDGSINDVVFAMAFYSNNIYVGGNFTDVNNGGTVLTAADYIAKWDGTNWSALGNNGSNNGSLGGRVFTMAFIGTNLYVGGGFTNVNNGGNVLTAADYIAQWDGTNWTALGSDGAGDGSFDFEQPGRIINALAVIGTDLYVGGHFHNVNNSGVILPAADLIAKWDGTNWSALGSNGAGDGALSEHDPDNLGVASLAVIGTNLYVGGSFSRTGGTTLSGASFITRWDGTNWSALGSNGSGDGALNGHVYALVVNGTDLYVGGNFRDVDNGGTVLTAADWVAKWDGTNWSALGSDGAGNGSLNSRVYALAVRGTNLYVGGWFTDVNDGGTVQNAADYLAKWDGMNWTALSDNGTGNGSINNRVWYMATNGGNLYVGGEFTDVNDNGIVIGEIDHLAVAQIAEMQIIIYLPLVMK